MPPDRISQTIMLQDGQSLGCAEWLEPGGGLPMAAISGRYVIQIICKADKRPSPSVGEIVPYTE